MENPFHFKGPLTGKDKRFSNRTSEIMRIQSRIAADRPQSVSIVGQLSIGKTSLLNWFCDPESQEDFLEDPGQYVFIALHLSQDPPQDPEAFFERINQAWKELGGEGMEPTFDGFNGMVKGLMQESKRLLLFLDNFGRVTQNSGFPLGFFSFMRSVANSNDVGYVTTSSQDLQKLCYTQDIEESPFFNIFTTVHLEPFKEKDAREMVERLSQAGGEKFGEETDWILELAGGAPYLLQLTGYTAFQIREQGKVDRKKLAEAAFREAKGYIEKLWGELTPVQQDVLRATGVGKNIERRHEYAAEALMRYGHLIQEEGKYQFRSELLDRFVKEHGNGGFWKRLFG